MWIKAHRVKHCMGVQESRLDAEETFKMERKDIRNSLLQTRIEKQRETRLNVKQEITTVVNTSTTKFYTDNEMTEGSSDKLAIGNKCDNATQKSDQYTKRNYLDISISAIASVRSIAAASIINGFLADLIKACH